MTQPSDPVRALADVLAAWEDAGRRASSLEVFRKAREVEPAALFAATRAAFPHAQVTWAKALVRSVHLHADPIAFGCIVGFIRSQAPAPERNRLT